MNSILILLLFFVIRGAWKTSTFKKYNFEAEGVPTDGGALHPLLKVREEIRNIFLEMGSVLFNYPPNPT
jgi:phenylalanyl-tRNA synthetase alpha chain